jgi:hypothetical protein
MNKYTLFILVCLFAYSSWAQEPPIRIIPKHYVCYKASAPVQLDGLLSETDWQKAEWTDYFADIEGVLKPEPGFKTRAKLLWDDKYLYIAAQLEEPHVWATLTERESVIFIDPDFEVFIDPDGDTHNYLEYEMNAFNTQWDLLLLKPYRDDTVNNVAIDNWNFNGIESAVHVDGTINDPRDIDKGWSLEIAFPLDALAELSSTGKNPVPGEQYRIDFSRVEWTMDIDGMKYSKRKRQVNGQEKPLPEDNWVWSPQGVIAMHQPETWGFLQFSGKTVGSGTEPYLEDPDNTVKWALRMFYYREKAWKERNGSYSTDLNSLGLTDYFAVSPVILLTQSTYEATLPSTDGKSLWHIIQDGRIWETSSK